MTRATTTVENAVAVSIGILRHRGEHPSKNYPYVPPCLWMAVYLTTYWRRVQHAPCVRIVADLALGESHAQD